MVASFCVFKCRNVRTVSGAPIENHDRKMALHHMESTFCKLLEYLEFMHSKKQLRAQETEDSQEHAFSIVSGIVCRWADHLRAIAKKEPRSALGCFVELRRLGQEVRDLAPSRKKKHPCQVVVFEF